MKSRGKSPSGLEWLIILWCLLSGLFTFVLAGIMLADGIPPSELLQCLDRAAQSHTTSSK